MNTNYLIKFIFLVARTEINWLFLKKLIDLIENMGSNCGKYIGINRNNVLMCEVFKRCCVVSISPLVGRIQELSK